MAVDSSKVLVNVSYVDGQEVVVGDKTYIGYSTIAAAAAAVGDTGVSVEVTGTLESEVVSGTALNLVFTDGADVSLAQDQTIQLSGESTWVLADDAVLTGNTAHSGYGYGWDAIRSSGNLTVEQFDGKIDVYGQNARAILVRGGDLVVNNGLNGTVTAVMGASNDKQNGTIAAWTSNGAGGAITINGGISGSVKITGGTDRGRQIGAILAYQDLTVNGGISGSVSAEFQGGNNAWGLVSWYKDVIINGDIAASATVEGVITGASHVGIAIYAMSGNVVINGEVAGTVYGKGGTSNGYGVYAKDSIEIGSISGTVRGDAYNDLMANTQCEAAALYAENEVSGGKNADGTSKALVITESGELLSTVGRSGAAGIQAGGAVTVDNRGTIQATSEYLLDVAQEHEMPQDHSNGKFVDSSWGGLSFGILANGQMDITNSGTISAVKDSQYTEGYELGYAIYSGAAPVRDKATGIYVVQPNDTVQDDRVVNTGILQGNVALNSGDDVFTQAGGSVEGFVDMGTGRDTVNVEADWTDANLIFDGSGADILNVSDGVRLGGTVTIADTLAISGSGDFSGLEVNGSGTLFVQDDSMTGSEWAARSGIILAENVKAITLQDIDTSVLRVDAAWEGSGHADEVEAGYYYGINAFSTFESAYVAATAAVTVEVGSDLDGVTGELGWSSPYRSAIRISSADGQEYTLTFQSHNADGLYATNSGQTITIDKEISLVNMAQLMSTSTNTLVTINGNVTSMQMWAGFGGRVDINETGSVTLTYGDGWLTLRGGGTVNVTGSVTDTASIDVATAEAQVKIGYSSIGDARSSNAYENSTNVLTMTNTFVDGGSWMNVGADGWHSGRNSVLMSNSVFKVAKLGIYDDGRFDVTAQSRVILTGELTVADNAVLTLDYTSSLTARSLTGSGSINITVDAAMLAAGIGKLIDLTDDAARLDTANITINGTAWDSAQKTFTDADGNTYTLVIQGNDLWKTDVSMGAIYVNAAWPADTAFGTEVAPGYRYGINAFSGLNQAIDEVAEPEKIVIAAGTYDENAVLFVKGVEVASENAVFSNVWSFGVNSDTGRDFDMETAEKFTVTGDLTVGQFYAEKNANVYVKIDGYLTTVGSFGAKLATQVDVNGTVTVTPEPSSQVMVYGTMNVTGTLDVTTGAMGAVLIVGRESYETEYGKGGVLNVSGADASVVLRNNTGSAIPVTVSALSSLTIADGATFINETGGLKNLGTVTVNNGTLTLREAFENSGTLNFSNTTTDFGTVANADGGMVNFLGGNEISGTVLGGGDVNFNGILSFEEAAEGEPSVIAQKNGAAVTLKAGKDVLTGKVAAEDVNVGGMASGMVSGVEQLVLQGGSLALEDLTIHAGSSLTMDLNSSFAFSGTVAVNQAGVVVDGTTAYVYGAGSFTVDASAFTTGSYKVIDYTGTAVQDYSFVSNLGELENKLIFNNDLYITDKNAEILYVSNSYTGDAGDVTADGNILGYNAFATAKEAFSSANSSGGATIDLQDEVYTYAAPQGTGVELTNAGTYTVINGKGVLLNYELEVNPDKADGEYLLNVEDAHLTLTKLTLRANATMTVTDSRIDYNAFEGGSAYLSVYTNSVLNVSGSTIGFDPRQSKVNDPADLPDAGTGAGAYWNWAPTWNIYGTANIEDSTLFAYVGQANQAGFDVRGNGTATITGSEVSLALLNVGTSYEENKLDPAADKSNLLATLTLDGTTVRNTQYRGDYTTQNGINVGQEDGTSAGKLVIRNGSDIDFTVLTYNDAREIGLSVRNDKSSVEISDSTFKAPSITNNGTITVSGSELKADEVKNDGTILVSGTSTLNIGSVNAASGDAHRIQIAAGTTLKDSVIGGEIRVLGDLTVDGELALGNGGIWCGYGSTQTTATISGGMITAKYAMFQYGTYVISADMTLDYGYLSYGGTFTVNSTIKASGQSGEPFYVRGDVTLADGGKLLIDKALWLDYEGAVLTVADGAAVEAGGLKLIADTSMNVNGGSVKVGNTLENNGTFTVSGASTLNIGKLTGNMLQVVADTTLTDSVIGGNVSVGFNAENAADTTLTLAGDTSIGTLYVGKENRTNDYKLVIAGEETTVKLGSLYSRTGSTTTISNGATLDISDYWQSKGMVTVDASTINHSGYNFYVYNNDSTDTAAIALMNGAVLNHIKAYSLTLGSTTETVSGVAKGNASVTLEGGSTLNVNRLYLNATGTVEEVAGAEAKTSLTAVDSTVTARGEVGIGAGATVSLGNSAFTANTLISSGAIVMDSLSSITCAGAFTSTGTITARVDAAQSGVSFVQKLINASTLTVNDSLTVEGGREGAQLVATGNALWLDNSDKSTILINSEYAGEIGSAIAGRDGYFFGFNALTEYSTSIGADSAVEFTGGSYSFADGFSFTGREFTVSGDTSFDKVTGGAVAVTGGTLSIDTVELTANIAALSGALLAFSGSGMADLANLVLTVSGTMANRTKYVLATGVKDDSFAVTLNGETYELNVRKDGLLVGVENGELYVQKSNDWFMLSRDTVQTVLPEDGYAFGGSDMHESAVMSVERDLNVATNGQNAGARVYGGGLLRNDALFSGTQKCEVTVTAGGVGKGVIGGNRVESGSIGGTLTSSVTIDSADGTFGFIVGGNQLTGGELNGFGGTSVTIQNGTFSMWICGGSVAGGDAAAQVMGNTNVTITGGTFNGTGVFGGGFVQENGTLNQVGNTNVAISGGTFAGNIYGGHGATNKDASPNGVLFGNTNITISGGIFNGNIYGGGFDQSKVQGDTHITFTGTAGADFSVNGIIDGDASNARYWSKGSFVTGDRYLTFDAFTGEFGATLITNIDQMEVTGGSDVNLKNQLDLSEVSQWEFDFGSSLEGFAQNDLAGDTLVLSGWEDQLGDEGWTVMSGSSITGFGEMEVTNGSNLIFAWNADEQYYLGSIGDEQFKLSMEDGAMKLAKLA